MTRRFFTLFTTTTLCVALTAGAYARPQTAGADKDVVISQLQRRAARLDWDAQTTKGAPRAERELQSLRVKQLIERLQADEAVDPQEIDKLLKEQPWPR
jgi:hypothetical protein